MTSNALTGQDVMQNWDDAAITGAVFGAGGQVFGNTVRAFRHGVKEGAGLAARVPTGSTASALTTSGGMPQPLELPGAGTVGAANSGGLYSTIGGKGMDPALFSRIQTAFQRKPGRIMGSNPASELHLGPNRLIEGETLSQNVIALRMNPSTSSVYEELIHTAQIRRGMTNVPQMEIEAAQKLIRFADQYKIPASETAATIERLRILQGGAR
jgi:hypothetical protein